MGNGGHMTTGLTQAIALKTYRLGVMYAGDKTPPLVGLIPDSVGSRGGLTTTLHAREQLILPLLNHGTPAG